MEVIITEEAREYIVNSTEEPKAVVIGIIQEKSG
jgi:hypothetical protein